ncbi:hypothetical protein [Roseibium sp. RKSG952]|uniref:hypothetical protein n=1 Tax=Roseibium sp. RKSG952 TaxID=2529384 RepID=UPI0012BC50CA|nr:hypothetical protein [Roseibium sp. RKSG952]
MTSDAKLEDITDATVRSKDYRRSYWKSVMRAFLSAEETRGKDNPSSIRRQDLG